MDREQEGRPVTVHGWGLTSWWRSGHHRRLLLLGAAGLLGIALMLLGNVLTPDDQPPVFPTPGHDAGESAVDLRGRPDPNDSSLAGLETQLSHRLEEVLANIAGTGRLRVLVTLSSGTEQLFMHDVRESVRTSTESDGQGGRRTTEETDSERQLTFHDGQSTGSSPVVSQVRAPSVRGVLVVAEGADDPSVRLRLVRAVQSLLDVPVHRIQVVQGKGEGR